MDVETTVQFLSSAGQQCCQAADLRDIQRPSNDLGALTFTPSLHPDYWLTFRSSKLGQCQSAISQCMTAADDVIDDECVQPEVEAAEAEFCSLPRQRMSTSFTDVALCLHSDQTQTVI